MWRIPWTDRIANAEVLNRMQKECEIVNAIKKRKLQYLGYIMRGQKYTLLQLIERLGEDGTLADAACPG